MFFLPVGYWSIEGFSKVASAIGKPIRTDNYTANVDKISYARILIEVDVSQPLPDHIHIKTVVEFGDNQLPMIGDPNTAIFVLFLGMRRRNAGTRKRKMR